MFLNPTADGYTEVKRTSTGSLLHLKSRSANSTSRDRLHQPKQASLDQPSSLPPLPPRPAAETKEEPGYHTPNVTCKSPGSGGEEAGKGDRGKGDGEGHSQDSVFDSSMRYDLPSNSRRLTAMNVTLRRNDDSAAKGYAKLDHSKEALLLRSGVTLRRLNYRSLSSVSSFYRDDDTPEYEGSDIGSGTTPDTVTDEEDGLEPVNK